MKRLLFINLLILTTSIFAEAPVTHDKDDLSDRISKHNDLYAIFGVPDTKIQISLK